MIREPLPAQPPIEGTLRCLPVEGASPHWGWHLACCGEPLDGHFLGPTQAEAREGLEALNARRQLLWLPVIRVRELEAGNES